MKLALRRHLGLPVLAKELVELASRRRTYVLRLVYALLLFLIFGVMLYSVLDQAGGNPFGVLGQGRQLFSLLVTLQFVGIYLFLPAMMCGAITTEKERNSLQLLLVTDLRPWEILISKLVSRTVPMVTFLLLSMPLLAIVYAFGGVTAELLAAAVVILAATILQVATFCLMVSAWCRTTAAAFITSYAAGLAFYFALPMFVGLFWLVTRITLVDDPGQLFAVFPVWVFIELFQQGMWGLSPSLWAVLVQTTPILISSVVFMVIARLVFRRRALLPPTSGLRALFKLFDAIFHRANVVTGGVVLVKDRGKLPGDRPVAWLEVHQRALGQFRYLMRIFVLLEGPVLILVTCLLYVAPRRSSPETEALSALLLVLWPIAALLLAVQAAGAFTIERSRQTLDILLATPMTGREIVKQKAAALWRLGLVVALPLLSVIVMEAWWEHDAPRRYTRHTDTTTYLAASLLAVWVYLSLAAWLSLGLSMLMKSPTRAILTAVGVLVAWCAAPPIIVLLVYELFWWGGYDETVGMYLMLLSPATIIPLIEFGAWSEFNQPPWVVIALNFAFYGGIAFVLRWLCLRYADPLLGRA